ncbi:MAG: hypothetical protein WC389_20955, partial [Lutibacter sp.]
DFTNSTSTEDVQRAVLGITIRTVQRAVENKLKSQAGGGRDVSGYADMYLDIKNTADSLLGQSSGQEIGQNTNSGKTSSGINYTIIPD